MNRKEKMKRIEEINEKIKNDFDSVTMDELKELLRLWEDEWDKCFDITDCLVIELAIIAVKGLIKVKEMKEARKNGR